MRIIPRLYWKAHEMLEKQGLDDETLALKFRINKKDAAEVRREISFWYGENPKGGEKRNDYNKTRKSR